MSYTLQMRLKSIELSGFKSFAKKTELQFASAITSIVGPNGSGKSNVAESFRFVLGEQSMKSMRGKRGEDMIWNGSTTTPRAGRASVKLIFDNTDRALNLDFDEVSIERVVHRDGGNEYVLNGSVVRLRDVAELLSQANIGSSGHHIISQGEADRVLSASTRERRQMIEDGLGLTAYLYKKIEAEKKLDKTAENMREVEGLRRELAPHLRFLGAQVKKIEDSEKLRGQLLDAYREYFKRESVYLCVSEGLLQEEMLPLQEEFSAIDATIAHLKNELGKKQHDAGAAELLALESNARRIAQTRDKTLRDLGRVEGEITAHEHIAKVVASVVPGERVRTFAEHLERGLADVLTLDGAAVRERIQALVVFTRDFLSGLTHAAQTPAHSLEELAATKRALEEATLALNAEEEQVAAAVALLRQKIENEKDANREGERELFSAMARRNELSSLLHACGAKKDLLAKEREAFRMEVGEALVLVGNGATSYEESVVLDAQGGSVSDSDMVDEPRDRQEERRRKLERLKIRLEETGASNASEIMKEHEETTARDTFLSRELTDLGTSAESLRTLIADLNQTLEVRFAEGIEKINIAFDSFFKLMFGGGSAALEVVQEKKNQDADMSEEEDAGVEIAVSLPHKRIKGLHMLSGGERALTSIALIFAMSQVNPPPFLILDETDAALDEANSRRYGDMIETLAKHSQLIVITHNRETMSRAGVLYGITMGSDGGSKLLSVKFEEALAVAK